MARFTNTCNGQWGTYYNIYLDITQNSQNISNNTSNVTVHLWAQSTNSAYHAYNLEGGNPVSLYVNNTLVDPHNQNMDFRNQQIVELSTWSGDITHNADGTGSVTASGSFTIYGTSSLSSGSVSGNLGLTTIPRTSIMTIEPSKQTMGSTITLKTNRNSTSFTHNFEYKFGNNSGTIATGVGDSTSWTVPVELAHQVPNSTSGSGTIICHTYSGNTHIGTSQAGFQANVPENYKPSLSITAVSEATSGIAAKFGAYIKGKSKLTITVTGNGSYSSSIKSYRVEVNGSTYTGGAGSPYKLTTGALWTSGSNTIKAAVTDSRGRSSSQNKTVTVLDYTAPAITALSVVRSNADGTANSSGDHMKITYAGSITALNNKNDKTFTVYYKESTASTYNQATTYTSGYSVNSTIILAADINKSYDILFRAKDYFQQVDKTTSVTTAFVLMDLHNSGTSIAFGKVAETSNMLDVNLAAHFRKNVQLGGIANLESYVNGLNTSINGLKTNIGNKLDLTGGTLKGGLTIPTSGGSWISGMTQVYVLNFSNNSSASYHPIIRYNQNNGNVANIGAMSNRFGFFGYKSGRTSNGYDCAAYLDTSSNTFIVDQNLQALKDIHGVGIYSSWGIQVPLNTNGLMFSNQGKLWSPSGQHLYFRASSESNYVLHLGVHDGRWALDPDSDGYLALGTPNHRFNSIFSKDPTIYTSDRNEKRNISHISNVYEQIFMDLKPVTYNFKDSTSGRIHTGFISQDIEESLQKYGLTTQKWAAVCKDKRDSNKGYIYGLRYEEIIALNTHMLQKMYKKIIELEKKINE